VASVFARKVRFDEASRPIDPTLCSDVRARTCAPALLVHNAAAATTSAAPARQTVRLALDEAMLATFLSISDSPSCVLPGRL
jgi:hypothetical protein